MPCACKVPAVEYPETAEWGPITWQILHGLAELSGRSSGPLQIDEIRAWLALIESIEKMIPCEICRAHYKSYLVNNPVKGWLKEPLNIRDNVRKWLWNLHNEINEGSDKPVFAFDDLVSYSEVDIRTKLAQLAAPIKRAMAHSGVKLLHWLAFERSVKTLLSFG